MFQNRNRLLLVIAVLGVTFLAELIGGLIFGSLSLVSDSIHVFSDLLTLALTFVALQLALRMAPSDTMNFGYHRLEVFSALFNGFTLLAVSGYIFYEAVERYLAPQPVQAKGALVIACIGLVVNLASAVILHMGEDSKHDLNIRSAYLHLLGDAGASVAVIVGMLGIIWTGRTVIDPIVAGLISVLLVVGAIRVLWKGAEILLQKAPVDLEAVRREIRTVDGVIDVEDLRLWQVCSHLTVGSAHIVTTVERLEETTSINTAIQALVQHTWRIRHMTLHFETPDMAEQHTHDFHHQHQAGETGHMHNHT